MWWRVTSSGGTQWLNPPLREVVRRKGKRKPRVESYLAPDVLTTSSNRWSTSSLCNRTASVDNPTPNTEAYVAAAAVANALNCVWRKLAPLQRHVRQGEIVHGGQDATWTHGISKLIPAG